MRSAAPPLVFTILRFLATTVSPPHALSHSATRTVLPVTLRSHSCIFENVFTETDHLHTMLKYEEFLGHSSDVPVKDVKDSRKEDIYTECCVHHCIYNSTHLMSLEIMFPESTSHWCSRNSVFYFRFYLHQDMPPLPSS